jgi:DNA segregation ATPase FtsK/SpoIIIE-like protein
MDEVVRTLREELKAKEAAEIEELFASYDFRDTHGHPLIHCLHFKALLELAKPSAPDLQHITPEDEELVARCIDVLEDEKRASISLFQRRLGIDYTKAARVMDILESCGYVSAPDPTNSGRDRTILVDGS